MTLLTVAQIREHIETDLLDTAVQRLIDDADAAVIARHGPHTAVTRTVHSDPYLGSPTVIYLDRPIASVTSVTEYDSLGNPTVLVPANYELLYGGRALRRFTTPYAWGYKVTVVYTPSDDTAQRKRVIADLVKLAIQYDATESTSIGDFSQTGVKYQTERELILDALGMAMAFS